MNWYSCINQTHIRIGEFKSGTTRGPDREYRSGTAPFRREVPIGNFDSVLSLSDLSRRDPDRESRSGIVPFTREAPLQILTKFNRLFQMRPRSGVSIGHCIFHTRASKSPDREFYPNFPDETPIGYCTLYTRVADEGLVVNFISHLR